jgi:uncharacterized protein
MTQPLSLGLVVLDGRYAICRLSPEAPIPSWAFDGPFCSITRTPHELSVVCAEGAVPEDVRCERGWRCIRIAGPLDFALTGVLASLVVPLRDVGVSLFAVSTFDTDYLLAKDSDLERAVATLVRAGHRVQSNPPTG